MKIIIRENVYIYFVIILFFVPFPWIIAWIAAVFVHEFFHLLAVRLLGSRVYSITIDITGAQMISEALSKTSEIIAILSGPVGGFILTLAGRWFPRFALCSWVLSAYNLLPLLPLDGGRALQILMNAHPIFYKIEKIILIALLLCVLYLSVIYQLGLFPLIILAGVWFKNRKKPCKEWAYKVQ